MVEYDVAIIAETIAVREPTYQSIGRDQIQPGNGPRSELT